MSVAIMQPTYLPWAGYFNLMSRVSTFVFLDDVQFAKPSWQMRNRILHRGAPLFLSVPTRGSRNQALSAVLLAGDDFRSMHVRTLEQTYGKHPHGGEMLAVVAPLLQDRSLVRLVELTTTLIEAFARRLGLNVAFRTASSLAVGEKRAFHLREILRTLGETEYLSPEGSRAYMVEDQAFEGSEVRVDFQSYTPSPYGQKGASEFVSHLSLVDVVAHLGWAGARSYIETSQGSDDPACEASRTVGGKALGLPAHHGPTFLFASERVQALDDVGRV